MPSGVTPPQRLLERLRRLCLSLPEVHEAPAWGHPNFRAGARTFAVFERYRGRPCIVVKLDRFQASVLVDDVRFSRAPYVGKHGWVTIWVDRPVAWKLIEDLVMRSYRLVALKRMLEALDGVPPAARRAARPRKHK